MSSKVTRLGRGERWSCPECDHDAAPPDWKVVGKVCWLCPACERLVCERLVCEVAVYDEQDECEGEFEDGEIPF